MSQRVSTPGSGDRISAKYGFAASSDDITLTTYFKETPPTTSANVDSTEMVKSGSIGRKTRKTSVDENDNLFTFLMSQGQEKGGLEDINDPNLKPFSLNRFGSLRQSSKRRPTLPGFGNIDRERPSSSLRAGKSVDSTPVSTPSSDRPWRERVNELLREDEALFKVSSSQYLFKRLLS